MSVQVFLSLAAASVLSIALAYSNDLPFFIIQVPTGERRPPLSNPLRHPLLSRHLPRLRQSSPTPLPRRPEPMLRPHPLDSRPGRLVPVPLHLGYTFHQDFLAQRRSYSDSLVRREFGWEPRCRTRRQMHGRPFAPSRRSDSRLGSPLRDDRRDGTLSRETQGRT